MSKLDTNTILPVSWSFVPLKELGDWSGGGTPSKAKPQYWQGGTIPWVSPKDMKTERISDSEDHITKEAVSHSATSLINAGSVLIVTRSGILRHTLPVAVNSVPVTVNQDLKALTPQSGVLADYVAWALRAFSRDILNTCTKQGTTVNSVETGKLLSFEIPMAPTEQQQIIVAEIEKQFSRLDEAVANLKRVKANLKRYKASVLKAAVEGALVPIKNRQATKIGEVADLVTKGASPNWQGFTYTDSGVAFVRSQNVGWGSLDLSDVAHLSPAFNEKERKSVLRTGDVLLNIVGASIGRAAVATPEIEGGNVNQAVAVIRLNKERMLPKYLMFNLLSPGTQAAIHAEKVDVARANVSLSDIKDFSVLFPSLAEQGTMVAEVERRLSVIEKLEAAIEANLTRADRLRQAILGQAFSGKLLLNEARG